MPKDEYLTSPQASAVLGCSARTVHRLVTAGRLVPAQKLPGPNGAFLFRAVDVSAIAAERSGVAA